MEKKDLRSEIELQFRYRLYMDPAFPFLISLGINNLFQGFRDKEFRFVGIIHLWWGWENNHFLYDKHIKSSILNSGFWHSKWFNSQEDEIKLSKKIES